MPSRPLEPNARRFRATVAYDGTDFCGWQIQPDKRTVQGELETALEPLAGTPTRIFCSGRTDTGVHAVGQVVHFDLATPRSEDQLFRGWNSRLPDDVRVMQVRRAAATFDARFSATGKEYRYFIRNEEVCPPHLRRMRCAVREPLDLKAMRAAAAALEGRHDFAAFCANPGYEREGTVRNVYRLRVLRQGPDVVLVACGEGFLYRMVRSLAGFLIRVGRGQLPPETASDLIASRERTAVVPTAPACGLFLWRVRYGRVTLTPATRVS